MLVLKAQSNLGGSYQKLKHVQKDRTEVKISPQKAKPHIENKGSHRRLRHAQKAQKKLQKAKAHTENRDPHRSAVAKYTQAAAMSKICGPMLKMTVDRMLWMELVPLSMMRVEVEVQVQRVHKDIKTDAPAAYNKTPSSSQTKCLCTETDKTDAHAEYQKSQLSLKT
ncbi:MAG: hypothetical protein FRX49_00889 [Trebouxia sp. A1-2]|nr:MAG: hypothetical protein FRX49_00889 [Trebouxia sp. A1-2]